MTGGERRTLQWIVVWAGRGSRVIRLARARDGKCVVHVMIALLTLAVRRRMHLHGGSIISTWMNDQRRGRRLLLLRARNAMMAMMFDAGQRRDD